MEPSRRNSLSERLLRFTLFSARRSVGPGEPGARSPALPSPSEVENRQGPLGVMMIAFKEMKLQLQWKEVKVQSQ